MMTAKRTPLLLVGVLATVTILPGCGFFRTRENTEYRKAEQTRALEIPSDLNAPDTSGVLVVPERSGSAAVAASAAPPLMSAVPAEGGAAAAGETLQLADTLDSSFARVGLALERSGTATVLARDAAKHIYEVQARSVVQSDPGWFKKTITLGRASGTRLRMVPLTVRVEANGDASKVTIESGGDEASLRAARDLLQMLRQRLT